MTLVTSFCRERFELPCSFGGGKTSVRFLFREIGRAPLGYCRVSVGHASHILDPDMSLHVVVRLRGWVGGGAKVQACSSWVLCTVYSCQKLPVPFFQHPGLCRELL